MDSVTDPRAERARELVAKRIAGESLTIDYFTEYPDHRTAHTRDLEKVAADLAAWEWLAELIEREAT